MEVPTEGKRINDYVAAVLAVAIVSGFFWAFWLLMSKEIPGSAHDVLLVLLGALVTNMNSVYQFLFGSSKGSEQSKDTLNTMVSKTIATEIKP